MDHPQTSRLSYAYSPLNQQDGAMWSTLGQSSGCQCVVSGYLFNPIASPDLCVGISPVEITTDLVTIQG